MRQVIRIGLLLCVVATALFAQAIPSDLESFLRERLAFTPLEIADLQRGQIVIKLPATMESREVAAFGIMRLQVPPDYYVSRFQDIVNFKKSENVLQIGKFSNPPKLEDLAGLSLEPADIEAIRQCHLNKCDVKMPAHFIERFMTDLDWTAPNYRERANALMRERLLEYVKGYLQGGNAELAEYRDKSYRLRLGDEFRSLLMPAPYMYDYSPEFENYLETYPRSRPQNALDFIYWSKEKFGLKPVISITHVIISKRQRPDGNDVVIASKGIYASHYFEASLGLTALVRGPASDPSHSYLIYLNRSRADALRGPFSSMKRALISSTLRDGARKTMEMVRQRLESEYRQ
ncbi:MAG TPA: hypothetical protein VKY31_05600 [Terriglobia bacterium]|nr:hypothetical protein [Terriglobia bacterium]